MLRLAPVRLAPVRLAPVRSTRLRLAPDRLAYDRSAPLKFALFRLALDRSVPLDRSAPARMALLRSSPCRLQPARTRHGVLVMITVKPWYGPGLVGSSLTGAVQVMVVPPTGKLPPETNPSEELAAGLSAEQNGVSASVAVASFSVAVTGPVV